MSVTFIAWRVGSDLNSTTMAQRKPCFCMYSPYLQGGVKIFKSKRDNSVNALHALPDCARGRTALSKQHNELVILINGLANNKIKHLAVGFRTKLQTNEGQRKWKLWNGTNRVRHVRSPQNRPPTCSGLHLIQRNLCKSRGNHKTSEAGPPGAPSTPELQQFAQHATRAVEDEDFRPQCFAWR